MSNTLIETHKIGLFSVEIHRDENAYDPEDMTDSPVYLTFFHREFHRCPKAVPFTRETAGEWIEEYHSSPELQARWAVFSVEAYIHGGIVLSLVQEGRNFPDRRWDVSRAGWVVIEKDERWWGDPTKMDPRTWYDIAKAHIEEWNQYIEGDVYGYEVKDEVGEVLDSCWGFYGKQYALEDGLAVAKSYEDQRLTEDAKLTAFAESLDWEALVDAVHDVKSQEASVINNNGKRAQVDFLRSVGFTRDELASFASQTEGGKEG